MILVAGSANLDFVVRTPRIPAPGETVLGGEFRTYPGGKGANQAVACARAGAAATSMLLALGNDAFAGAIEQSLRRAGVRMLIVRAPERATGAAFITVADDAQNAITVAPGANYALQPADLPPLDGVTHLLLQLEIPLEALMSYARAAHARGVTVVLNAAPARALPPELLAAVDILVVNETELEMLSGVSQDTERALARLDVPCVVATLGAQGCVARIGQQLLRQAGFPVTPVDTTAAGDTFCGVLVAALSRGNHMPDVLRQACAAAALACTQAGAQSSIPSHVELQAFLQRQDDARIGGS
jgi:ribokinase